VDTLTLPINQFGTINVLENDTDPDEHELTLIDVKGDFVDISFTSDGDVEITPYDDFTGSQLLRYIVQDSEGAFAESALIVTVEQNQAPVAQNDIASTDDRTSIIIDVLANDIDPEDGALIVDQVQASNGTVSIVNNQIKYTPLIGFDGVDTILYFVEDSLGADTSAVVEVTVQAHQTVVSENKSGGSIGTGMMALLLMAALIRRRATMLAVIALLAVSHSSLAQGWYTQIEIGQASAEKPAIPTQVSVINYDLNDTTMLFGSYAQGYKSPAFDLIFSLNESRTAPVPAETNVAWEGGVRSEMFDRRLRLSATAFHTTFENFQGQAYNPETVTFSLTSAGEVITKGLELEFNAKPVPELLISGGVAFIDATYGEFMDQQCYFNQTEAEGCIDGFQSISGGDVPNSPDTKITLSGKYNIYLDGDMDMFVSANYRWQDEVQMNQNQAPYLILPSYGVLDLTVGIQADDGQWVASVFAKNALDDNYVAQIGTAIFDQSNINAQLTRDFQRYMGVEFTYRFGAY